MNRESSPVAPHLNAHFLVDLGDGNADAQASGFCEVVFPEFRHDASQAERRLILRRGATGALDLYTWWDEARRDGALRPRTLIVSLMTPDLARPVMTWTFHGARPIALSYGPLNALHVSVLLESVEIEFDRFEMR